MDIDWAYAGPSILAAFLASLVEFVEALTVAGRRQRAGLAQRPDGQRGRARRALWNGAMLFAGLALILIGSVALKARR